MRTLIDASFLAALDEVAREENLLVREPSRALVGAIQEVSASYNELGRDPRARRPPTSSPAALSARLQFFLPRDVGKTYEAARDLLPRLAAGATVRVVDVGAGLGASALGLAMLVRDRRPDLTIELTLLDDDRGALCIAEKLFTRIFPGRAHSIRFRSESASAFVPSGDVDVILASNVLCELERGADASLRADRISALVHRWGRGLAEGGHLLIVEPALRSTARALQAQRDRFLALGFSIVAPCTHPKSCPLLVDEADWCHEDRAVALPAALIPIARAAGLHFEGLTFSYLLATRSPLARAGCRGRVVAPTRGAKGKRSLAICFAEPSDPEGRVGTYERLDRHRGAAHEAWQSAERGAVVAMTPWPAPGRVGPDVTIEIVEDVEW